MLEIRFDDDSLKADKLVVVVLSMKPGEFLYA